MHLKLIFFILILTQGTLASSETSTARISDIDQRLSDLELESYINKFSFSGTFFNHFESYTSRDKDIETNEINSTAINPVLMKVALNIDVNINNKLSFYSTIGMSKFWNQAGREPNDVGEGPQYESMRGSYGTSGPDAFFDTAYINYKLNNKLSLSLGRMTTNFGPPIEQVEGVARSGTYPRFAYNAIFDGFAVVYDGSSFVPNNHSLKFRAFYTPFIYVDETKKNQRASESSSSDQIEALQNQTAVLSEYSIKGKDWFRRLNLYYMIWNYESFYDEGFQDEANQVIEYSAATSQSIYFGVEKILNSNFNINYTYYTFNERFTGLEEQASFNYLINLNYKFDKSSSITSNLTAGFEYINTDDIYYLEDLNSLYIADFYTRHSNNGYHVFFSKPIDSNQILRVGYFNYNAGVTEWNEEYINSDVESIYLRWKVFF